MDPAFLASLDEEHALSRLRRALQHIPARIVAVDAGATLVGFCRFGPTRDPRLSPGTWEIFACNVHPGHWRRGFGSALVTTALSRVADLGGKLCILWVLERNLNARNFYAALGFSADGGTRTEAADTKYPLLELRYARPVRVA